MIDSLEQLVVETAAMVRPPERLSVAEAAEKYRWLNNPGAYVGPFKNSMAPYLVEPQEILTSLDFEAMIFVGPAQSAKTEAALSWITHTAICDPADMMIIQTSQSAARDFAKRRVERLFRHTKEVGKRVLPGRQNQNIYDTKFTSGWLLTLSWPTINELSGKPIPRLWLTDYDRMPEDVDKEGSPFDLARKRATTFKRFGMTVAESSPGFTIENPRWIATSPHEAPPTKGILALYNRGDRRRWYWRCPQCHESFESDFSLLSWPDSADPMECAEQATMVCPHDGFPVEHGMKQELNAAGRWVRDGMVWTPEGSIVERPGMRPIRSDIASFWLKGPAAAFVTWKTLVFRYLQAVEEFEKTGGEEALKSTVNTDQGLPYTPRSLAGDRLPEDLKNRAQDWGGSADDPVVPPGVRFLVATVDVQGRSFVCHVHGIGVGGDVWIIDMFKIRKSERLDEDEERQQIDPAGYLEDWNTLIAGVVERTYPLADGSGRRMQIKMVGCDSGGRAGVTTNAYNWWRSLREAPEGHHKRVWLVKGEPSSSAPRYQVRYPDASRRDRHSGARGDVPVVFFNSNLMKDQIYAMLGRTDPGGGMIHFPAWAEDWLYTQLTAETRTPKGWESVGGRRNEAWDLLYYAVGLGLHPALRVEHIDWEKPPTWAAEWDANDLVFAAENTKRFASHAKVDYKWGDLADKLA